MKKTESKNPTALPLGDIGRLVYAGHQYAAEFTRGENKSLQVTLAENSLVASFSAGKLCQFCAAPEVGFEDYKISEIKSVAGKVLVELTWQHG